MPWFTIHLSSPVETLLLDALNHIPAAMKAMERNIMAKFDELKASVDAFITLVESEMSGTQVDVDNLIAEAIAKDDADEEVDFAALKASVDAAFERRKAKVADAGGGVFNPSDH